MGNYKKEDVNSNNTLVYYNPDNPIESYVDKKTNDMIIKLFFILGICFFIVGVIFIVFGL